MDKIILTKIIEKLRERQKELELKDYQFAKYLGISQSYLSGIYTGARTGERKLVHICIKAGISIDSIVDKNISEIDLPIPDRQYGPIPIISWVQAGDLNDAIDPWPVGYSGEGEPVFSTKKVSKKTFALRVNGDSMAPRFLPGDIIIVDPEITCDNGDFCVVKINNEATMKVIMQNGSDSCRLVPLNKKYPEWTFSRQDPVEFKIIGKVVDLIPNLSKKGL